MASRCRTCTPSRPLAIRRRTRNGASPGRGPLRRALPLQDPRLRHGHRRRTIAGTNGATRRPCCICASATTRGADLDQPSRRDHPVRLRPPVLLGRLRHAAARATSIAAWRSSTSTAPRAARLHPCLVSPPPSSTRAASRATPPSPAAARALAPCVAAARSRRSPTARPPDCELRHAGRKARWIVRLGAGAATGAGFRARFAALAVQRGPGRPLVVDDPEYGVVEFRADAHRDGRRPRSLDSRDEAGRSRPARDAPARNGEGRLPGEETMRDPKLLAALAAGSCSRPPADRRRRAHHVVLRRRRRRGHQGPARPLHEGQSRHQRHPRQRRLQGRPGAAADPARGRPRPRHRPRHQPQGAGRALARPAPLLADPAYWHDNFGDQARLDAAGRLEGHHRLHDPAHADRRLRQQDAVRAGRRRRSRATRRPGTTGSRRPARSPRSQQIPAAFAIDRSGHRISGPNISYGANYIGADGMPAPLDEGVKDLHQQARRLDRATAR